MRLQRLLNFAKDNLPAALTGIGIVGVVVTAINAHDDTLKAEAVLMQLDEEENAPESSLEAFKATWKCYIPTCISGALTIAAIAGAGYLNHRKKAALLAALALTKADFASFETKARELFGSEKVQDIKKDIAEAKMKKSKAKRMNLKEIPDGMLELYEPYTDQYIYLTKERLSWAVLEANRRLQRDFQVSLNDLIKLLGGVPSDKGAEIGWNFENEIQDYNWGYFGGVPWIEIMTSWDGEKNVATLYYEVGPEEQKPEDMIWYGQDKYYAGT